MFTMLVQRKRTKLMKTLAKVLLNTSALSSTWKVEVDPLPAPVLSSGI